MFGTLDSWLLYKLNGGRKHVTEPSNAISTGMNIFVTEYMILKGHHSNKGRVVAD